MASPARTVSIVLPIYNQADHLRTITEAYRSALSAIPNRVELILVPNGCRDDSVAICQELASEYEEVRCEESPNGGWGNAVLHGISNAGGDVIGYTNVARTSPEDLVLLVLYAIANPDSVVKAERKIRESFLRRLGSLIYNLECRALFDLSIWDINGTPKFFPRTFGQLLHLTRRDDLIDLEFNWICRREGYRVLGVPIFSTKRHGGKSTTNVLSAVAMYKGAWDMSRQK